MLRGCKEFFYCLDKTCFPLGGLSQVKDLIQQVTCKVVSASRKESQIRAAACRKKEKKKEKKKKERKKERKKEIKKERKE